MTTRDIRRYLTIIQHSADRSLTDTLELTEVSHSIHLFVFPVLSWGDNFWITLYNIFLAFIHMRIVCVGFCSTDSRFSSSDCISSRRICLFDLSTSSSSERSPTRCVSTEDRTTSWRETEIWLRSSHADSDMLLSPVLQKKTQALQRIVVQHWLACHQTSVLTDRVQTMSVEFQTCDRLGCIISACMSWCEHSLTSVSSAPSRPSDRIADLLVEIRLVSKYELIFTFMSSLFVQDYQIITRQ